MRLTKIVLKMIMSTGTAVLVLRATGAILCPIQNPIDTGLCIQMTSNIWELLRHAGMTPLIMSSLGGVTVFIISGRWLKN